MNAAIGYFVCFLAMLGIYYNNTWNAKSLPFMSTRLLSEDGSRYPLTKVFVGGVLDHDALQKYGIPKITGTFAYAMFMANAAVSLPPSISQLAITKQFPDRCSDCTHLPLLGW